ncbi:MAG: nucleotidyltransferase family protein [Vicinamibacterales bacterium]
MSASSSRAAEEVLLSAALRGAHDVWRDLREPGQPARFLDAAARHRVRPLLAWQLRERGELAGWPNSLRNGLLSAERAEAAIEIVRRAELCRLLRAFEAQGIPVLLLKGAAFAYSLYPEPWLRPRQDTDLLIRPGDVDSAAGLLDRAGYVPTPAVSGQLVAHQRNYVRPAGERFRHDCDLHWKACNPVSIADVLPSETLLQTAGAASLGDGQVARIARADHALLLACLHRASHHHDSRDLLWLYDIHLLAERLTGREIDELIETARRTGSGAVCARGLRLAVGCFETRLPSSSLLTDLETSSEHGRGLPTVYLRSNVRKADLLLADLGAIPGWRGWVRLLKEHLFPPADYMLAGFRRSSRLWLPVLYAWRIARGARGWFRPL